jgi:hypothetical protein
MLVELQFPYLAEYRVKRGRVSRYGYLMGKEIFHVPEVERREVEFDYVTRPRRSDLPVGKDPIETILLTTEAGIYWPIKGFKNEHYTVREWVTVRQPQLASQLAWESVHPEYLDIHHFMRARRVPPSSHDVLDSFEMCLQMQDIFQKTTGVWLRDVLDTKNFCETTEKAGAAEILPTPTIFAMPAQRGPRRSYCRAKAGFMRAMANRSMSSAEPVPAIRDHMR